MNDRLRRALFEADLSESDVAVRLGVDPKTARRWLDGTLPQGRHRRQLALILGLDEGSIWPQLRATRPAESVPAELAAAYPRRNLISQEDWLRLFAAAEREIGLLAYSAAFLTEDRRFREILADKGDQGVRVSIVLGDPKHPDPARADAEESPEAFVKSIDRLSSLRVAGQIELRRHNVLLYNSIYRVDNQMLVNQHLFGIAAARTPVVHLHKSDRGEMFDFYLSSFEEIWRIADGDLPKTS